MSSNNINESAMLKHIIVCFQAWGIDYISKETLKRSQSDCDTASLPLTRLLFDLTILSVSGYQYQLTEVGVLIEFNDQSERKFTEQLILSFLSEISCPYILDEEDEIRLDFSSSRKLLLVAGWLMAKDNFFQKIRSKLLPKKYRQLFEDHQTKPKHRQQGTQNSYENDPNFQKKYLIYHLLNHKSECFERKKLKIIQKLEKTVHSYNKKTKSNITIDEILGRRGLDESKTKELREKTCFLQLFLQERIEKMKNQQFFWAWLELQIKKQMKQLRQNHQAFQEGEGQEEYRHLTLNPSYLTKYLQEFKVLHQKIQSINSEFTQIEPYLNEKKTSGNQNIEKEVKSDLKKLLEVSEEEIIENGTPCFLAIEIRKYFEDHGFGKKMKRVKRESKKPKRQLKAKEGLLVEINEFIHNLGEIKFL